MEVEEVVNIIVSMTTGDTRNRGNIVGNQDIYEAVTGLHRYSKKRWEALKPILQEIGDKREYEVDGVRYILQTYSPMFSGHFNFYRGKHLPESFIWGHPCAGFSVFKNYDM